MSRHAFSPEIAEQVGVNAAVIYQNIIFWCERNAIKGRNINDGNAWTYNSMKSFSLLFPYLSERQIRTALEKLEQTGLLIAGCFNKDPRDRTKWYAVHDKTVSLHLTLKSAPFDQNVRPLPDVNTDINLPPNPQGGDDLFSESPLAGKTDSLEPLIEAGFNEWWGSIWPSHNRKAGKADCFKVYTQACTGKHVKADQIMPQSLNAATRRYIASVEDRQYLKAPLAWLRAPGWEAFMDGPDVAGPSWETLSDSQRRMLERHECPPSMMIDGEPNADARALMAQVAK